MAKQGKKEKEQERASVKAEERKGSEKEEEIWWVWWCNGGLKRAIISEKEKEMGAYRGLRLSQCPVPWGGTQGRSGECEAWRGGLGGNKADYCPLERGLVLGQGGTRSQSLLVRMDGWMSDWLSGWMDAGSRLAAWLAFLPTEQACKETGAGLGNARHEMWTKPATVPWREALSWAKGHEESAFLDGWIDGLIELAFWLISKQTKPCTYLSIFK